MTILRLDIYCVFNNGFNLIMFPITIYRNPTIENILAIDSGTFPELLWECTQIVTTALPRLKKTFFFQKWQLTHSVIVKVKCEKSRFY